MFSVTLLCSTFGVAYVAHLYLDYRRMIARIGNFPGFRKLAGPVSIVQGIANWVLGRDPLLHGEFKIFEEAGWDVVSWVNALPRAQLSYILADPNAIKEVTTDRTRFVKPTEIYKHVCLYGNNIVASEGEEWKRHRKITAPAFSERNNELVWNETARVIDDLISNVWKAAPEVVLQDAKDVTLPIAISVISAAGFGQRSSWLDDEVVPTGHRMTFKEALHRLSCELTTAILVPRWAMGITQKMSTARLSIDEMQRFMLEMINERRYVEGDGTRSDLFSLLMGGLDDGDAQATDRELTGNIFMFLLAGHETTAHTLAFALGFLALYPGAQDRLFREIHEVTNGFQKELVYGDFDSLVYTMAVFNETVRMMPPINAIPKRCTEDTTLTASNQKGDITAIPIPAGTFIVIDAIGLHYNPRYWPNPYDFKPERFLGQWNRDAFISFSAGARGCMGRTFAETEAVVVLARILSQYTVRITDDPDFANESFEQRKARVLMLTPGLTTTPAKIPLTLSRRA